MNSRPWIIQVLWLALAGALLGAAGWLHGPLNQARVHEDIISEGQQASSLLEVMPGGFRAPIVAYLWMRVEDLKQAGKFYEIMQLSEMICELQPRFPGVWDYHAWNMAYNVSVQTRTPEERWLWVNNGVEVLRNKGIPYNPKSIILYRQLAWIFNHKIGDTMDEMHMTYKRKLAAIFQRLLASPPYGTAAQTLEAFRPIAEAPIDRSRQADDVLPGQKRLIQLDQLARLLQANPEAAAYLARLTRLGVRIDNCEETLLDAYNRLSADESVQAVRRLPVRPADKDKPLFDAINDPKQASARTALLSFVRAQILWNRYRMDPAWMMEDMNRYGPLDWRLPWPHAVYWTTLGMEKCEGKGKEDIDFVNNDRNLVNALKSLTWFGRMTMIENPTNPDQPEINLFSDLRFIDACHNEHDRLIRALIATQKQDYKDNQLADGHINYLASAVQMLYAAHERDKARQLMAWERQHYGAKNPAWNLPLREFVLKIFEQDGKPIPEVAFSQVTMSIQTAMLAMISGQQEIVDDSLQSAREIHDAFLKGAPPRLKIFLPSLEDLQCVVAGRLLVVPRESGYNLSLVDRARLYSKLPTEIRAMIYDAITPRLTQECAAFGTKFETAFPVPPGLDAARQKIRQRLENQPVPNVN